LRLVVWRLRLVRRQLAWLKRYTYELVQRADRLASR
jgi:hypothetical protein